MITVDAIYEGLVRGEFFLEYIPTVTLADRRCVGAEALARWQQPSGLVPPNEFIPLLEETSIAGMFTHWVIETVGKELSGWLKTHTEASIAINIPPMLLGRGGLLLAAQKAGLEELLPQLIVEVTERGLPDRIGLEALERAGRFSLRIALDDVNLSGANLALLTRCNLDIIKLDKFLISQITPECPSPEWLAGLSTVLQSTKVAVIAEGVETEHQVAVLQEHGVPMAQGFYFSRPILAEDFKAYYSMASPDCHFS